MSEKLRSVKSNRSYPDKIEDETFCLTRRNSAVDLIYEVKLKDGGRNIVLGTCKVLDKWTGKCHDIEVTALKVQSSKMRKKMKDITKLIRYNIV